jgi:two-component sensor histidine kinase
LVAIADALVTCCLAELGRTGKVYDMTNSPLPLGQPSDVTARDRKIFGIRSRYWKLWLLSPLILLLWILILEFGEIITGVWRALTESCERAAACSPEPLMGLNVWQWVTIFYCCGVLLVVWIAHFEKKALVRLGIDADSAFKNRIFSPRQWRVLVIDTNPVDALQRATDMLTEHGAVIVKLEEGHLVKAVTAHSGQGFGKKITISVSRTTPCHVGMFVEPRMSVLSLTMLHRFFTDYGRSWSHMRTLATRMNTLAAPLTLPSAEGLELQMADAIDAPPAINTAGAWQRLPLKGAVLLLLLILSIDETNLRPANVVWGVLALGLCVELLVYFKFRQQMWNKFRTEMQSLIEFVLHNFWIILILFTAMIRPSEALSDGLNISAAAWAGVILLLTAIGLRDLKSERGQRVLAETRREKVDLERQLAEAKLVALSAQIEPHFLFNTLSSIQYLIRNDSGKASEMTSDLIRYLRLALPRMKQSTASLADELDLVRAYLGIMQIRMGARLQFAIDLPKELADVQVPTMTLITLVENAIKHGLEQKAGGGMIHISATSKETENVHVIHLQVADTGGGFSTASSGTGIGLANIRERLSNLYKGRATLELEVNQPTGVKAILIMPMERT